ncbi:MAG TPA: NAD(P)-dependent oxidoreductase [Phytomonospora sp.]
MSLSERTSTATRTRAPVSSGVTVYGCGRDEAVLFRELAPRFGVLPTIIEAPVSEANVGLALGNRCVSVGHKTRVANRTLLALARAGVEYVSTRSVGRDHIDTAYAASVGITVGNVSYSPDSVADYTLMLMLMALRHGRSVLRAAEVHDYRLGPARGRELRDLTVGVVGAGRIGMAVVDRLRGFGCRVLVHNNGPVAGVERVGLDELLGLADVVTLHTPLTADTHHLLDRARIARMRPGAVVVNTGRGSLVDTAALIPALESGRLGGAALDVVEGEEGIFYADRGAVPVDNELLLRLHRLPNALISPHIAYYTDHALADTVENSLINCRKFAGGKA